MKGLQLDAVVMGKEGLLLECVGGKGMVVVVIDVGRGGIQYM